MDAFSKLKDDLSCAKAVLEIEAQSILQARDRLDGGFTKAINHLAETVKKGGKIVVTGVGKSGKIASKISATLSSIGAPSVFLHPSEAAHGDLGIFGSRDTLLALSYSGSAEEILRLLPAVRSREGKVVAIVGNSKSELAKSADVFLDGSVSQEACPHNLVPTSSTAVALALGDALAVALGVRIGFKEEDFAENHPGGNLGRRLALYVRDLMKTGEDVPWVDLGASMEDVINASTEKKLGAVLVGKKGEKLLQGIVTDGDIRRALRHKESFFKMKAKDVMTKGPVSIGPNEKAVRALELMENRPSQISLLPVVDGDGICVGLVRLHDLIGRL